MSSDLSALHALHAQTSAILEKLYDQKGQPDEIDEAFTQEYFKLVKDRLNLDDEAEVALGPHQTNANLSQQDKGLIEVYVADKKEKFVVSRVAAVKTLSGTSQRFGSDRGKGTYVMTSVKGIPNITIKTGSAIVAFVGLPNAVKAESGKGAWEKA